jgi:hypothetical protein
MDSGNSLHAAVIGASPVRRMSSAVGLQGAAQPAAPSSRWSRPGRPHSLHPLALPAATVLEAPAACMGFCCHRPRAHLRYGRLDRSNTASAQLVCVLALLVQRLLGLLLAAPPTNIITPSRCRLVSSSKQVYLISELS